MITRNKQKYKYIILDYKVYAIAGYENGCTVNADRTSDMNFGYISFRA